MTIESRIQFVRQLFDAYSYRGGPAAIDRLCHPDMVVHDLDVGEIKGRQTLKDAWVKVIEMWPDQDYELGRFWPHEDSIAFTWIMKATVTPALAGKYGTENVGREWRVPGMSYIDIVDGLVLREFDFYDGRGVYRSLGIKRGG